MTVVFFPRSPRHQWNVVRALKEHARTAINADDETIITVSERGDSGRGGARTIVLIMHPRRPAEAVSIDKPLEQITQTDLADALAPFAAPTGLPEPPSKRNDHRVAADRR
ncbi:hypothetical protein CQ10_36665 [Bradyrhizobium valentinum]|uniref:Uncharacterized protein n=1 Tax=Bradyrhizobium valentinum TaxID=1518501 RepID=A0A0R3KDD4_9BRAD|nr:hypothetical protein CP49_30625 [Bradyrhizobium valentinum]KRQ92701.1 hypothetical protein CQ10_36665 [Bradyrhizobium valentinum]